MNLENEEMNFSVGGTTANFIIDDTVPQNQVTILSNDVEEGKFTEFTQNDDCFKFTIDGNVILEVTSNGDCYKMNRLIQNDSEIFDNMKEFLKTFVTYNEKS